MRHTPPMNTTHRLTVKETAVLVAVSDSEYRDGDEDLTRPVWSSGLRADGVAIRGMGGVFASLSRKGMIELDCAGTSEATAALTAAGIAALSTLAGAPPIDAAAADPNEIVDAPVVMTEAARRAAYDVRRDAYDARRRAEYAAARLAVS